MTLGCGLLGDSTPQRLTRPFGRRKRSCYRSQLCLIGFLPGLPINLDTRPNLCSPLSKPFAPVTRV